MTGFPVELGQGNVRFTGTRRDILIEIEIESLASRANPNHPLRRSSLDPR
jgi:hypothetical protein